MNHLKKIRHPEKVNKPDNISPPKPDWLKVKAPLSSLFNKITLDENSINPLLPIKLLTLNENLNNPIDLFVKSDVITYSINDSDKTKIDLNIPDPSPDSGSTQTLKRPNDSTLSPEDYENIKIKIVNELIDKLDEEDIKIRENYNSVDEKYKTIGKVKTTLNSILNNYSYRTRNRKSNIKLNDNDITTIKHDILTNQKSLERLVKIKFGKYEFEKKYHKMDQLANKYNIPISKNISVKKLKEKLKNFYNLSKKYNIKLNKSTYNNLYKLFKLQELSKKFNINITKKYKNNRVYKSIDELKKEIKSKLSKK